MGTYNYGSGEFAELLEEFLQSLEGDISAEVMARAWNILAKKYLWEAKLKVKFERRRDK